MEKHRCTLCYKRFSNGRALGGHMRSHMMNLPVSPKPESGLSFVPSSSSDSEHEGREIVKEKVFCKLSKKSRKISKLVDENGGGSSSVGLHDRESDTESTKNVTRRRSKRRRKPAILQSRRDYKLVFDDINDCYYNDVEQYPQQQLGSSISEVTSEEDVAFCLMMMSRDKWDENGFGFGYEKDASYNNDNIDADDEIIPSTPQKKRYKCETCNKVFRSYQALGGHRASHKKTGLLAVVENDKNGNREKNHNVEEKKVHECPICFRLFNSGQALGGHKRSHVRGSNANPVQSAEGIVQSPMKKKIISQNLMDLNLPAPIDDDYDEEIVVSQIASSTNYHVHF